MSRRSTVSGSGSGGGGGSSGSGLTPMSAPPRPPTGSAAAASSSAPPASVPAPAAAASAPVVSGPPAMRPRSNSMDAVYSGGSGIRTQGRLEVGGAVHHTSVSFAGTEAHRHLDDFAPDLAHSAEQRLSHRDAEVGTLSQMNTFARAQLPAMTPGQTASFELHGDHGPCDGCKQRVQTAATEWSALLPPGTRMQVASYYMHAPHDETRSSVGTTYGYHADSGQTGVSYGSSGAWLFAHPVAKFSRPAPPSLARALASSPGGSAPSSSAVVPASPAPADVSAMRAASTSAAASSSVAPASVVPSTAPAPKPVWGAGGLHAQVMARDAAASSGASAGVKGGGGKGPPGGAAKPS